MNLFESASLLDESDLTYLEESQGIALPEDYRRFLLAHNGGYPELCVFPIDDFPRDTHAMVGWFFALEGAFSDTGAVEGYQGLPPTIEEALVDYRNRVPSDLLPIARDPGGNLICLGVKGEQTGKVYFWDHNEESIDEEGHPTYLNVYKIADTFTKFLNSLVSEDLFDLDQ
ncbi:MAG: SMI1/KNR4 family protein [Burkholderiales bacterium]|nr:SMI1/KNR4 family protein [Anaerolineae bacterium]